jgi:hypothetical protein
MCVPAAARLDYSNPEAVRALGYYGTMSVLIGLGVWAANLSKDYWGF